MINVKDIIAEMRVLPEIDIEYEIERRVSFIAGQLQKANCKNLVLGISGGIDSATCGKLAQLAVNKLNDEGKSDFYRFMAVRLPYDTQLDEEDAQLSIAFIEPSLQASVNVRPGADGIHSEVINALSEQSLLQKSDSDVDFAKGNVKARTRMVLQYEIAAFE